MNIVQWSVPQTPKQFVRLYMQICHVGNHCSLGIAQRVLFSNNSACSPSSSDVLTNPSTFPSLHLSFSSLPFHNLFSRLFVSILCFHPASPPLYIFITHSSSSPPSISCTSFYSPSLLTPVFPQLFPCSSLFQLSSS